MTALFYLIAAVAAATWATRAWLADPGERTRRAFLVLGWLVATAYVGFAVSLFTSLEAARIVYTAAGCLVAAAALTTIDRLFIERGQAPWETAVAQWPLVSVGFAVGVTVLHLALGGTEELTWIPGVVAGGFSVVTFGAALHRLWLAHDAATLQFEKARLRYLGGFVSAAVLFTTTEQIARIVGGEPASDLTGASHEFAMQGLLPPFSVPLTAISLYLLYSTVVMSRLLDVQELFGRLATLVIPSLMLMVVASAMFGWLRTSAEYSAQSAFLLFVISFLFLAVYDLLREPIATLANRMVNRPGERLADALSNVRRELPGVISTHALANAMVSMLQASGRVPVASVYLWDDALDAFACAAHRGHDEEKPLKAIAAHPFTQGFEGGQPWYTRRTVERLAPHDQVQAEILRLLDAMHTDLTIPFLSGGVVLGWLAVRDESWSDGYSAEEIQRFRKVCDRAIPVLSNIREFQALEEAHRLAALGAMAAGLAHEIRNPLAGVKGAAQYLQGDTLQDDADDMLTVIVTEVNRLDTVVSQFLDYARPFELELANEHVNALVTHVLTLLRAEGLPDGIALLEDLSGDLSSLSIDADRFSQVVLNLLRNAVQAMPDGGTLQVRTRQRLNRHGLPVVEVVVTDTGVGISTEDAEKLFVPFFTTKRDGTGLGLAICQRIVRAHGGELEVQSAPGRGSTFIIRLPQSTGPETQEHDAAK